MANKIVTMNKLRKILRMLDQGNSKRAVSRTLGTSRKTIDKYASVFDHHPLGYKGLLNLSDKELYSLVLPPSTDQPTHQELYGLFPKYEQELQKIGVTKLFLWERYKGLYPEGVQYSQFCDHFGRYLKSQQISMVLEHKAGDKLMVDYAGKKLFLTDPETGEHIAVEFFVGILPSSGLTYARACYSQKSEDFLGCLSHCLEAIGGVPQAIVTDNLKPAVNKASKYDPELNKSMYDFAEHYQTTVLPTRARKPKDKALVESAVNILYTRVYAPLHDTIFHDLRDLNKAIEQLVARHNAMNYQGRSFSRQQQFEANEQACLSPLPNGVFELKKYQQAKVHPNCHVILSEDKHHYSVPFQYVGKTISIGYTSNAVEVFFNYERIAIHQRTVSQHRYSTNTIHLHPKHQYYSRWSKDYFEQEGLRIGPACQGLIQQIFRQSTHPEQGFKMCQGVLQLARKHGNEKLEQASEICLRYDYISYKRLEFFLSSNYQPTDQEDETNTQLNLFHDNIRGESYYQ